MKETIKHFILATTAAIILGLGSIASAQTTTPGVPNTGVGGDSTTNWLILATTGVIVLAGIGYLLRKPHSKIEEQ
ncbi:MAG: hypothetical protein V4436_00645 [Patescibacteria group bacterium]